MIYGDALRKSLATHCPYGHVRVPENFLKNTRTCKTCAYRRSKDWTSRNKDKYRAYARKTKMSKHYQAKKYGITPEKYAEMVVERNNLCDICKLPEKRKKRISIDHNHSTGKVRGLLCDSCNNGIGKLRDDPTLLISAANYLLRNS